MDQFFLKKLLGQVLMPLPSITLLLLAGLYLLSKHPHKAKWLIGVATTALVLLSITPVANNMIVQLENKYPVYSKQTTPLDYIVILGCGHISDQRLTASQELKVCSLQRMIEGLRIAKLHPEATIITSGAAISDKVANAEKVKQALIELGLHPDRIKSENRPKDTEEEAQYISPIIANSQSVVITNANHMPRALGFFHKYGSNPVAGPTGFYVKDFEGKFIWSDYFPEARELEKSQTAWYEYLGQAWQRFKPGNSKVIESASTEKPTTSEAN